MAQDLLKQTPRINPHFDFALLKDALSPLQMRLLQLITGNASVEMIIGGVESGREEALTALMQLVEAGCILVGNEKPLPPEATPLHPESDEQWPDEIPEDSFSELFAEDETPKPVSKKPMDEKAARRLEFDSILDDLIADAEEEERKTEFDDLLDEFYVEEENLPRDSSDLTSPDPGSRQTAPQAIPAPSSPTPRTAVPPPAKTRLPAIPGERLAEFIWEIFEKKESKSLKFVYGPNRGMVIDFFEGELIKIVPRPLDPHTFLGVLLVKHAGMNPHFIQRSIELRKARGVLQGEALIELGALPPVHIYRMLRMQAIWRLLVLMRCEKVGFRVFPPRVTKPVELPITWKQALFAACWQSKDKDFLLRWADHYGACAIEKVPFDTPADYGLGKETADLLKTTFIEQSKVAYYRSVKNVPTEVIYRALYSFYRIGTVKIRDEEGKKIESKLRVSYLDAEVETSAEGPVVASIPPDHFFEFEMMLDPDSLDFSMPEMPPPEPEPIEVAPPKPEPTPAVEAKPKAPAVDPEKKKEKKKEERERQRAAAEAKRKKEKLKNQEKEAREEFDMAMEYFDKSDWMMAHTYFASAEAKMPGNGRYIAYRAFSDFALSKDPSLANKTLAELKKARDLFGDDEEDDGTDIFFLYGMTHKLAGARDKANIYFNKVLEEKPNHTAALREVRLFNMAREKERGPKSGILSLFGGKKKK